jgi:acyl-CoA thioesterase-2
MPDRGGPIDLDAVLVETIDFLTRRRDGDGGWTGDPPDWFGEYLFGGFVIAQALAAATREAPENRRVHSMHAYFLRPIVSTAPISYRVETLREGRTFTTRRVAARQFDKPALELTCSFSDAVDRDVYVYDLPAPSPVPAPGTIETEGGPGPWIAGFLGATPPRADGTRESTHRMWFRIPADLPGDPHLHTALLGFATDWTGIGGRPLHLDGDTQGMVSLDHAAWFHRAARADEWLFYDVHSLVNAGGRGLLRGVMRAEDGKIVASVVQEMRLTPVEQLPG